MKNLALVSVLLVAVGLVLTVPRQVFSRPVNQLKVFHETVELTPSDLATGDVLHERVTAFASSVFQRSPKLDALDQVTATVREQALHEHWRRLTVDLWVGGDTSPSGYYLRYSAVDAAGQPVEGGAFVVADLEVIKANWPR